MDAILRFFRRLWLSIRRERFHGELAEEMAFHREQAEKNLRADGMSADAAHFTALRQFGNVTRVKEQSHEAVGTRV